MIFCLSNIWSILHHGSVEWVLKKCHAMLLYTCLTFFVVLHHITIIFISLSNVHNRILTNYKRELVVCNCQQKCIYHMELRRHKITWPGYKGTFSNLNLGSFLSFCMTFSICRKLTSTKVVLPTFSFSEEESTFIWNQLLRGVMENWCS